MDTKQVLKAMTREEKAALVCGTGRDSTFSIRALPSLKFVYGGFGRGGVRMPSAFALACSFDERAAYEAGLEEGRRCCASGEHVTADVPPLLPFCGENDGGRYRGFSSDSTLTMSLAAAYIDGVQSTGVGVCARTTLYGGALSSAERALLKTALTGDGKAKCSPKALFVDGAGNDGNYIRSLGFKGVTVSELGTVGDRAAALAGGVDLSMPGGENEKSGICNALNHGRIAGDGVLDDSALRVLELIDETYDDHEYGLNETERRKKSVALAEECAVLLKNDAVLPLSGDRVTIIGLQAESLPTGGEEGGKSACVSLVEAMKADRRVRFVGGGTDMAEEALEQTLPDETVIVVISVGSNDCFGNPRTRDLDEESLELIERLEESDRNVIAVIAGGGEADLFRASAAKGLIYAPYLGDGGGEALKKIILGEISPSGRLCEDFYTVDHGGERRVMFPFGYGLGYGNFVYSQIRMGKAGGKNAVLLNVSNDGRYTAADTLQVYYTDESGEKKLAAFEKIKLRARERREVAVTLPRLGGISELLVGTSKSDIIATLSVENTGSEITPRQESKPVQKTAEQSGEKIYSLNSALGEVCFCGAGKALVKKVNKLALKSADNSKDRALMLTNAAKRLPIAAAVALFDGAVTMRAARAAVLSANGRKFKAFLTALGIGSKH